MFRTTSCEQRRAEGRGPRAEGRESPQPAASPSALGPRPSALESGYTLAALLVVLTIISLIVAYTVPPQWSMIMRRERERQTIFLMKQFARGIVAWERKHQSFPVSLEQLQKARQPRMLRGDGKWACPLTGREDDWILVPPNAVVPQAGGVPGIPQQGGVGIGRGTQQQQQQQQQAGPGAPGTLIPEASPKDYVGPFVAVRPNAKGKSFIALKGADDYSQWVYTVQDLKTEIQMQQMALSVPK